jgi:excisionase family DNA binding protein
VKAAPEPTLAAVMTELRQPRQDLKASRAGLLTVDGVAQELALSPRTIRSQLSLGVFPIPAVRAGGAVRFRRADVIAYVNGLGAK